MLVAASAATLASGCTQFVQADCSSADCDTTGGSTTAPTNTAGTSEATTVGTSTTTDTLGTSSSETGTVSEAETGTETEADTETETTTGGGTSTGSESTDGTDTTGAEPICGDGIPEGDEACDDGDQNSDTDPDACRTNCEAAGCGDGIVDTGESCDDQNTAEADGCLSTCIIPTSCAVILAAIPTAADGPYDIAPDGNLLTTACDMTTAGGGWTLVGKVNNADQNGVSEPEGWFGVENNPGGLASPDLTLNASPESHGAFRFSPIVAEGTSLTRFEVIEGGNVSESVDWFKVVGTTASFEAWFGETDPDSSTVCTNVALTDDCLSGEIRRLGNASNNVTVLGGMRMLDQFADGAEFPVHIRQNNNTSSGLSGLISGTTNVPEWSQGYGGQLGNGLRIWLRE